MFDLEEYKEELRRLSTLLDDGLKALRHYATEYADAEEAYREAQARAWLLAPRKSDEGDRWIAAEREAWVNGETRKLRRTRDLADDMRKAAREAVRARQGQISAWQSQLNAEREEMSFARTGPGGSYPG